MLRTLLILAAALTGGMANAELLEVQPAPVTEWKPIYGEVEPRDLIPARARIGGTLVELTVEAGERVEAGTRIARVEDDKLQFRLDAIDAQLGALRTQLQTARTELERGQSLSERGVITQQRLDQLQSSVDVLENQIKSTQAERLVIAQQVSEGDVMSPVAGVVLSVPVAQGSVVTPGETVAQIAGGGVFLRLALPERHAPSLKVGEEIEIGTAAGGRTGKLIKIYPRIEGGRVLADVEVDGLNDRFIGLRVPVRLPVGKRPALLVPQSAVEIRSGLDFVTVQSDDAPLDRVVVPGEVLMRDGAPWVEILSGLSAGDMVVVSDE